MLPLPLPPLPSLPARARGPPSATNRDPPPHRRRGCPPARATRKKTRAGGPARRASTRRQRTRRTPPQVRRTQPGVAAQRAHQPRPKAKGRPDPWDESAHGATVDGAVGTAGHRRRSRFRRPVRHDAAGRQLSRRQEVRFWRGIHPPANVGGGARSAPGRYAHRPRPRFDDRARAADEAAVDDRGHVGGRREAREAIVDDGGLARLTDTAAADAATADASLPPIHRCAGGTAAGPPQLSHSGTSGPTQCTASVAGAVEASPAMHAAAIAVRVRRECSGKVCPSGGRKRASGGGGGENTGRRCGESSLAAGGAARGEKCHSSAPSGRTSPACPPGAALDLGGAAPHVVGGAAHSGRAAAAASSACWRAPRGTAVADATSQSTVVRRRGREPCRRAGNQPFATPPTGAKKEAGTDGTPTLTERREGLGRGRKGGGGCVGAPDTKQM